MPAVNNMESMPQENPLHGLTVLNEKGESVLLEELWQAKPVVLALVRHFG